MFTNVDILNLHLEPYAQTKINSVTRKGLGINRSN